MIFNDNEKSESKNVSFDVTKKCVDWNDYVSEKLEEAENEMQSTTKRYTLEQVIKELKEEI